MVDNTEPSMIRIDSPFGSLVTNSVKLGTFARQLAEIADRMQADTKAEPFAFKIGEIECYCHPNGG